MGLREKGLFSLVSEVASEEAVAAAIVGVIIKKRKGGLGLFVGRVEEKERRGLPRDRESIGAEEGVGRSSFCITFSKHFTLRYLAVCLCAVLLARVPGNEGGNLKERVFSSFSRCCCRWVLLCAVFKK